MWVSVVLVELQGVVEIKIKRITTPFQVFLLQQGH